MKRDHSSTSRTWAAKLDLRCLGLLLALPLLIGGTAVGANAFEVQINPSDDSFVEDSLPSTNFGSSGAMYVADHPIVDAFRTLDVGRVVGASPRVHL